jgi:hypothetical protein
MPPIKKTCKISGREFEVSEQEQKLRTKFGDKLPDVHPYERMRELLSWRNISTLYSHKCDLCSKPTLTMYSPKNVFPKYCNECFFSDKWTPPEQDINFNRSFFEQFKELRDKTPTAALSVNLPMVNSDYNNACGWLKNCYMCFDVGRIEDSYYVMHGIDGKNMVDCTFVGDGAEILYGSVNIGSGSYQIMWSENVETSRESMFLYDCLDCDNCFMSSGLRHKQNVFRNEQLSKEEYEQKIATVDTGSHKVVQELRKEFKDLKSGHSRRFMDGIKSYDVTGNFIYESKDVEDSYFMFKTENCVNCNYLLDGAKDCLDVCAFAYGLESSYMGVAYGSKGFNIKYSYIIPEGGTNIEYSFQCRNSNDLFGCVSLRKKSYSILNKQYEQEEYKQLKEKLVSHMKESGEYGRFFPQDQCPFSYNETGAQMVMPLTKEQALEKGYTWYEKDIPVFPPEKIYDPPDHINDVKLDDVSGKVIMCIESGRPFKIVKPEFDFYKKYNIPLPRLHPDVRFVKRYPSKEMYDLQNRDCDKCGVFVKTSLSEAKTMLCEKCYQKATY